MPAPQNGHRRELAALYRGEGLRLSPGAAPRVAVVGAGLAGLTAAHLLAMAGCPVEVYEASERTGGRIRTEVDDRGRLWELGGEFIDSGHHDMHALATALGLEMLDLKGAPEAGLSTLYHFGGRAVDNAQVDAAFAQVAARLAGDVRAIGPRPGARASTPAAQRLDRLSLADYLHGLEMDGWLRALIEVAYVTLYGADAADQSALNLLTMIGTDAGAGLQIFGWSDERFTLRDGSQVLTDALARRLGERVHLDRQLVRLRHGTGWTLTLASRAGAAVDVAADAVVLALPFTLLREVDLGALLPPLQRRAVDTLGYGASSKLILATRGRPWRDAGRDGSAYTDLPLQSCWDAGHSPALAGGLLTIFQGGAGARLLGEGAEAAQALRLVAVADRLFPGLEAAWTHESRRMHWPGEPFARCGYASYKPGQWTDFGGAEATPVPGGLYFAGEHCSAECQGYMNGAAETGRRAAMEILRRRG